MIFWTRILLDSQCYVVAVSMYDVRLLDTGFRRQPPWKCLKTFGPHPLPLKHIHVVCITSLAVVSTLRRARERQR